MHEIVLPTTAKLRKFHVDHKHNVKLSKHSDKFIQTLQQFAKQRLVLLDLGLTFLSLTIDIVPGAPTRTRK